MNAVGAAASPSDGGCIETTGSAWSPERRAPDSFDEALRRRVPGDATGGPTSLQACELCGSRDFEIVRDSVVVRGRARAPVRVAACAGCGLLFQVDRFDAATYERYYAERYRLAISDDVEPGESFVRDQLERGEHLYRNLAPHLPPTGRVLDVGCGPGGLLVAFARRGWECRGIDPDHRAIALGRRRFGLQLSADVAERLSAPERPFDLVVITGSLEHVADLGEVVTRCRRALDPGGRILLEGWGFAQARLIGGFGHNQKRYFTEQSLRWLLSHHGFAVEFVTFEPLCGASRPGSVFALAHSVEQHVGRPETPAGREEAAALAVTRRQLDGLGIR
jgi:SAM-dependent methyltransferase